MNVIRKKVFSDAAKLFPNDMEAILETYRVLSNTNFSTPQELKAIFSSLDNFKYRDKWWVIDIGGGNLRLMMFIQFVNKRMFVKHIVDHKEHNRLTAYYRNNKE